MGMVFRIYQDGFAEQIIEIWNQSATGWHGFYPITPEIFKAHILQSGRFHPENFLLLENNGRLIGWIHYDNVIQPPYPRSGVVCAMAVLPEHRCQGYGGKLLQEALFRMQRSGIRSISGLGAWPYSPFYAGLIDGSERAGVPEDQSAMLWLLDKFNFVRSRRSLIMRVSLDGFNDGLREGEQAFHQSRAGKNTWLDYVFRRWELFDHVLLSSSGQVLSRAIHARMTGLCEYGGQELHALFGVNTVPELRGKGYALRNLQVLFARLRAAGGQAAEIHVYADNASALRLYKKLGFREIGATVDFMLR